MGNKKLKPCPFCGSDAVFIDEYFEEPMRIQCTECCAEMRAEFDECTGEGLIEQWNRRPAIIEKIKEIVRKADEYKS